MSEACIEADSITKTKNIILAFYGMGSTIEVEYQGKDKDLIFNVIGNAEFSLPYASGLSLALFVDMYFSPWEDLAHINYYRNSAFLEYSSFPRVDCFCCSSIKAKVWVRNEDLEVWWVCDFCAIDLQPMTLAKPGLVATRLGNRNRWKIV